MLADLRKKSEELLGSAYGIAVDKQVVQEKELIETEPDLAGVFYVIEAKLDAVERCTAAITQTQNSTSDADSGNTAASGVDADTSNSDNTAAFKANVERLLTDVEFLDNQIQKIPPPRNSMSKPIYYKKLREIRDRFDNNLTALSDL